MTFRVVPAAALRHRPVNLEVRTPLTRLCIPSRVDDKRRQAVCSGMAPGPAATRRRVLAAPGLPPLFPLHPRPQAVHGTAARHVPDETPRSPMHGRATCNLECHYGRTAMRAKDLMTTSV